MEITYQPIGIVRSPFKGIVGVPIQPSGAEGVRGEVEIFPEYRMGLKDLEGFSHVILIYHFHKVREQELIVTPFLDDEPRGVFATRAPKRPNPIGLSVVRLLRIEGGILHVENLDILDGTPVLDIKPYVPSFDHPEVERLGWLENALDQVKHKRSDDRFGEGKI